MKNFGMIFALALAATGLASCGSKEEVAAVPEGVPGLEISNARLVLPAVKGNPAAVYFDLKYTSDRGLSLSGVDVQGAESAMIHNYGKWSGKMEMMKVDFLPLKNGTEYHFKPGDLHVMAMKPSPELKPGGKTEVTLSVSGGDKLSFPAEIRSAGDER